MVAKPGRKVYGEPVSVTLQVRVTPAVATVLDEIVWRHRTSTSSFVRKLVEDYIEKATGVNVRELKVPVNFAESLQGDEGADPASLADMADLINKLEHR